MSRLETNKKINIQNFSEFYKERYFGWEFGMENLKMFTLIALMEEN